MSEKSVLITHYLSLFADIQLMMIAVFFCITVYPIECCYKHTNTSMQFFLLLIWFYKMKLFFSVIVSNVGRNFSFPFILSKIYLIIRKEKLFCNSTEKCLKKNFVAHFKGCFEFVFFYFYVSLFVFRFYVALRFY